MCIKDGFCSKQFVSGTITGEDGYKERETDRKERRGLKMEGKKGSGPRRRSWRCTSYQIESHGWKESPVI